MAKFVTALMRCLAAQMELEKLYPGTQPEEAETRLFKIFVKTAQNYGGEPFAAFPMLLDIYDQATGLPFQAHFHAAWFRGGSDDALLAVIYQPNDGKYAFVNSTQEEWPPVLEDTLRPTIAAVKAKQPFTEAAPIPCH